VLRRSLIALFLSSLLKPHYLVFAKYNKGSLPHSLYLSLMKIICTHIWIDYDDYGMVSYRSQIIHIFYYQLHKFLLIIFNILVLSCFVFTRSTNMARFYVFWSVVIVFPIGCFGNNVQDKSCSTLIYLIKFGTSKTKFCLFDEGTPIIHRARLD